MGNKLNRRTFIKGASVVAVGTGTFTVDNAQALDNFYKPSLNKSSVNYLNRMTKNYIEKFTIIDAHSHIGEGEIFPIPFSYEKDLVDTQNRL